MNKILDFIRKMLETILRKQIVIDDAISSILDLILDKFRQYFC